MGRTCSRRFAWDAGHRVTRHDSQCGSIHGHRYTAWVTFATSELTEEGVVVDFGKVKEAVGTWIEQAWDHAYIACQNDLEVIALCKAQGYRVWILGGGQEPTAENLAECLFWWANKWVEPLGVDVVHVRLYETPNNYADFDGADGVYNGPAECLEAGDETC